jgi:hypothetical protein
VYLEQESQIAEMEAAVAAQRAEITASEKQLAKWKDPEYLRIQALERFSYVRPGETPLLVVPNEDDVAAAEQTPAAAPDRWYDTLWSSVQAADTEQPSNVKPQD